MSDFTVYSSADRVRQVINRMIDADRIRRDNRALVDQVFDGFPPYDEQEAVDNNIETNVNFLEGTMLMHDARNQYRNAFMKPGDFFTVKVDGFMNRQERMHAGKVITREMNRIMKGSNAYRHSLKSQFANVAMHGAGTVVWPDRDSWRPVPFGLNDVLIPDKTYLDLSNLNHFAVYKEYTPWEFWKITRRGRQGWNMTAVNAIMANLMDRVARGEEQRQDIDDRWRNPERINEEIKENSGYYWSDAVPAIKAWTFYTRDLRGDSKNGWLRYMIPFDPIKGIEADQFIFRSARKYADDHTDIFHTLWGNVSNKAPFRVHSVRSLGFLLYSVVQLQNRLRCRLNDAIFENLLWYFRVNDPQDRDRIQRIDLHHLGIIPEGVEVVGREDRWQPDMNFVAMGITQNRQLMGEAAASYRGRREESDRAGRRSATETTADVTAVQQMVTAILGSAYDDAEFQYRAIAKRFAKRVTTDDDVKLFQERVKRQRVMRKWMDPERWEIAPVKTLGGGNKMMETAQANVLMSIRGLLDPDAQRKALHLYVEANTDDPGLATEMVPLDQQRFPSNSVIEGQQSAGALMMGLPVGIPQEVNRNEYIAALLQSLQMKIKQVEESGGVPSDVSELRGMMNLSAHIAQNMDILAEDKGQNDLLTEFRNQLAQANNLIRAYGQRLSQKMQAEQQNNGNDPKVMAEIQKDMVKEQVKARGKALAQNQSAQQKQVAFQDERGRKALEHQQEMQQDAERHQLQMDAEAMKAEANAEVVVRATRR